MPSKRVYFENNLGHRLAGIMEITDAPIAYGMFSHCFTCTKDLKAIARISRNLAKHGIAILRFDFTGLGDSKGHFPETNFSSTCQDVMAAVEFLTREFRPPQLLIGHSLGGAAMMKMCTQISSAKAITTIASPSSTQHLARFLSETNPQIMEQGRGDVTIGGRTYELQRQLIEDLKAHDLEQDISRIRLPHLVFHPPQDETLPYWHAEKLLELTGGPKSLITLEGSDHLLIDRPDDVQFVADMIGHWFVRMTTQES